MTVREKTAWITNLVTLGIIGWYFWTVWADFSAQDLNGDVLFWRFIWCSAFTVAISLPASLVAAKLSDQLLDPPPDELERNIERSAFRVGLLSLEVMLVGVILLSRWVTDVARADYPADPAGATAIILINLVLFVMAVSAVVREFAVIVQYRQYA